MYFLDLLWLWYNSAKFHHCRRCVTDFRDGGLFGGGGTLLKIVKTPILQSKPLVAASAI